MKINWHTIRTRLLIVIVFLVAGLGAVHDMNPAWSSTIDMITAVLLFFEHTLAGKSSSTE